MAPRIINITYTPSARLFSFVLKQYVEHGIDVLASNKLSGLWETKYGPIQDCVNQLGTIPTIRNEFADFQQRLYCV